MLFLKAEQGFEMLVIQDQMLWKFFAKVYLTLPIWLLSFLKTQRRTLAPDDAPEQLRLIKKTNNVAETGGVKYTRKIKPLLGMKL